MSYRAPIYHLFQLQMIYRSDLLKFFLRVVLRSYYIQAHHFSIP